MYSTMLFLHILSWALSIGTAAALFLVVQRARTFPMESRLAAFQAIAGTHKSLEMVVSTTALIFGVATLVTHPIGFGAFMKASPWLHIKLTVWLVVIGLTHASAGAFRKATAALEAKDDALSTKKVSTYLVMRQAMLVLFVVMVGLAVYRPFSS